MEKFLSGLTKFKLIAIMMILCENKKNVDRIKSIMRMDLDEI